MRKMYFLWIYSWTFSTDLNSLFLAGKIGPAGKLGHRPKIPRIRPTNRQGQSDLEGKVYPTIW